MKMRASQKVHYDAGPNMTPLVDIVMVILIFLMLTGTFAVGEHFLQSNLPIAKAGVGGPPDKNQVVPDDVQLNIRVDGYQDHATGADAWTATVGGLMITNDQSRLSASLETMRRNFNSAQTPTDKIQVYIEPGENTQYKYLVMAYEAALDAQFTKVAFKPAHK